MGSGRLIARLTVGSLFVGHGTQKLFGWFGGAGPQGTAEQFEKLGLKPGSRHALGAGVAETAGGALLALGLLTPLATSMLTGVMATAIRKVHWKNGVWVTEGGFEYNAVLIAALALLAEEGPGRPSLDARLFPRMHGFAWALAGAGAGAASAFLIDQLGAPADSPAQASGASRTPEQAPPAPVEQAPPAPVEQAAASPVNQAAASPVNGAGESAHAGAGTPSRSL